MDSKRKEKIAAMSSEPRRKVYEIQTQLYDIYGQPYIDVDKIKQTVEFYSQHNFKGELSEKPVIRMYAGTIHDRDTYTEEEAAQAAKEIKAGDPKPEHIHIALNLNNAMSASALCKLFNINSTQLVYVRRRDTDDDKDTETFLDKAFYISHWRHPEKAQYDSSEIWCNFNYEEEFKRYCKTASRRSKSKHSQAFIREHVNKLAAGEETTKDIIKEFGYDAYEYGKIKFDHAQAYFEKTAMSPVSMRLTFIITGPSTIGKSPLAKLYACSLFPDLLPREAFYFASGASTSSVVFQNYTGQPVIIYDDWRAESFIDCFGRETLFNSLFAVYPEPSAFNIKYGSVILKHNINIITTIEDPDKFVHRIAGEYTDSRTGTVYASEAKQVLQSYKRIWSITKVSEEDIVIQINAGYLRGDAKAYYDQYLTLCHLGNNLTKLFEKYHPDLYTAIGVSKFPRLLEETHAQLDKANQQIRDPALIDPADLDPGIQYDIEGQLSMYDVPHWDDLYPGETPESVAAELDQHAKVQSQIEMFPILAQHDDPDRSTGDGSASPAGAG